MNVIFRVAKEEDLAAIVEMIADDDLGKTRENCSSTLPHSYLEAFQAIAQDSNQELIVIEDAAHEIVGTFQLSFLQYLTYQGGLRVQIEAVRIRKDQRGKGFGEAAFKWAIAKAKNRGAHLVQLTTDKQRPSAITFYEKMGFKASHEGMKLHIDE